MSRGGKNTKIHAIVDGLGNPVSLMLTGGNISDCKVGVELLSTVDFEGSIVMGDKAYGTNEVREFIEGNNVSYCIPPKQNTISLWDCDFHQYKELHLVECFFQKIKHFRRVATRYEKLASRFFGFVLLASIMILVK